METLFLKLLNMSITASYLVLAVLVLRLILKKAPRAVHCALWALVAVRLILPDFPKSALSLQPSAEPIPSDIVYASIPAVDTGVDPVDRALNPVLAQSLSVTGVGSVNPVQIVLWAAGWIWILGVAGMGVYALASWLHLRRRVAASVREEDVLLCDYIDSPFILGIFRPRIYLPSDLPASQRPYVIAHERAHLARRDHWWKPLGYLLLTVYWFNPLLWIAYGLLCRDVELACDERVIHGMDAETRVGYSRTLLNCSVRHTVITACPLAFGEVGVKERVKTVLNYKKPAFWITLVAVLAVIVAGVCFLTSPTEEPETPDENVNAHFDATVLEVGETAVLVTPVEGVPELASTSQIWVSLNMVSANPVPELVEGDIIRVVYNGEIQETYPAQINTVFGIYTQTRSLAHLKQDVPIYFEQSLVFVSATDGNLLAIATTDREEWTVCAWVEDGQVLFSIRYGQEQDGNSTERMFPVNAAEMGVILSSQMMSVEDVTLVNQTGVYTDEEILGWLSAG